MDSIDDRQRIVVLCGQGQPARAAVEVYLGRLSSGYDLFVVEEVNLTLRRIFSTLGRYYAKRGAWAVLGMVFLRLLFLVGKGGQSAPAPAPALVVKDINSDEVIDFITAKCPSYVLTCGCSIIGKGLLQAVPCPFLNIHSGINPRYRGAGNVYAFHEESDLVGVTVHRVDEGIDTGEIVSQRLIRFDPGQTRFRDTDTASFRQGAELACEFILFGRHSVVCRPSPLSVFYGIAGLGVYRRARANYYSQASLREAGDAWAERYVENFSKEGLSSESRMEWHDASTIEARNATVAAAVRQLVPQGSSVLDVGCGDGRLAEGLAGYKYAGVDILRHGKTYPNLLAEAGALPFPDASFDCITCVGLFQSLPACQSVADELYRVLRPGGVLVLSTLRQFTLPELCAIFLCSLPRPSQLRLAWAILRKDYRSARREGGTLVARRYSERELQAHFPFKGATVNFRKNLGFFEDSILCRELVAIVRRGKT